MRNLLDVELYFRKRGGEEPTAEEYRERFREFAGQVIEAAVAQFQTLQDEAAEATTLASTKPAATGDHPAQIGRYRVKRPLGTGGFGTVYLARDERLSEPLRSKCPMHIWVFNWQTLRPTWEAQTLASLDHPHIVPVYDVGSTDEHPCLRVSSISRAWTLRHKSNKSRCPTTMRHVW